MRGRARIHAVLEGVARLAGISLVSVSACGPTVAASTSTPVHSDPAGVTSAAASTSALAEAVDARATPPGAEGTVTFVPPKIEEARLRNGMRILFIERHELPIVSIEVVADRGADQTIGGACAFMAAMLTQGSKKHGALALADELERLGASWGSYCSYDAVGVRGKVLSDRLPQLVALLAEVVRTPTFDAGEVERERKRRLTQLQQQADSPGAIVWKTLQSTLYPTGHPYALQPLGNVAAVTAIRRDDLVRARAATLTPSTTTIVAAGDVTRASLLEALERSFGDWNEPAPPPRPAPGPAIVAGAVGGSAARVIVVDRPGASQSTVQLARVGVARDVADWPQVFLTNYVFGGHFASRLNMNLREKHAYTYGAGSGFSMWHGAGPFSAGGEIKTEHTVAAVREILDELARMRDAPITDEELTEAQTGLVDQLPGRFVNVDDASASLAGLVVYHLALDEYATRPARYRATTAGDVQRVARAHLRSDDLRIVIVGDAAKIEEGLAGLGLGAPEVRRGAKGERAAERKAGEGRGAVSPAKKR